MLTACCPNRDSSTSSRCPHRRLLIYKIEKDTLHTQGLSAREIVQDCGGDYLMTVKANQKGLLRNLKQIHVAHKTGGDFSPSDGLDAAR